MSCRVPRAACSLPRKKISVFSCSFVRPNNVLGMNGSNCISTCLRSIALLSVIHYLFCITFESIETEYKCARLIIIIQIIVLKWMDFEACRNQGRRDRNESTKTNRNEHSKICFYRFENRYGKVEEWPDRLECVNCSRKTIKFHFDS